MNISHLPVIGYLVNSFNAYGFTRKLRPTDNHCLRRIEAPGLIGVEDISIDQARGMAYLSAADRRRQLADGSEHGALFRLDLSDPDAGPERISASGEGIYPHGIAVWIAPDGHRELYAIDHAGGKDSIRRYRVRDDGLELLRVYADPLIHAPNDLTVAGDGQCYVTNDHGLRKPWARTIEEFTAMPVSNVIHINDDGNTVSYDKALTGVPYANGIAWHAQRAEMYVAAMTRRQVWRCSLDADGQLRRNAVFDTNLCVDNIEIDADGALWIGGHPKVYQMLKHMQDARAHSASQVIRMDPATGDYETLFEDDGAIVSGSSVGARWRSQLLVGSVCEPFIIELQLAVPASTPPESADE